ncbi:MAG: deoxynucleoside kinase [Chloroflexota bacterium]
MKKQFITIAGNIGIGKSTLVTLLAKRTAWEPVFEAFDENPYLADFYGDMKRWSFNSQIFFLSRRIKQHFELLQHQNSIIQDRSVYEDAEIFAQNLYQQGLMSERDWDCYFDLYKTTTSILTPPDLVIYLKGSVRTLTHRIQQRGRDYELDIEQSYLNQLNTLYDQWAENFSLSPVLTVETDNLDYVLHESHLDQIWDKIQLRLSGRDYLKLT